MIRYLVSYLVLLFQLYSRRTQGQDVLPLVGPTDPNGYWCVEATIGMNQKFSLLVDTGSADLWVYNPNVLYGSGSNPIPHNMYTCVKGATSNCSYEGFFSVTYGAEADTITSGNVTYDRVNISGVTVEHMGVESAYNAGTISGSYPDGILGLSFGQNNRAVPRQHTFMERLIPTLPEPVFGVSFVSKTPTPKGKLVDLEFGYINQTKLGGPGGDFVASVPVTDTIWRLNNVSFGIGSYIGVPAVTVSPSSKTPVSQSLMFDTGGGSQFAVDPRITQAYYDAVPGATPTDSTNTTWTFPCDAKLPDLTLKFGNGEFYSLRGQALIFNTPVHNDTCAGPLSSQNISEGGTGGVGALFFESTYTVFNMGHQPSISFVGWNGTAGY